MSTQTTDMPSVAPVLPFPTSRTRVFSVLGDPIAHSLSPLLHNTAFHALHLDAVYLALRCTSAELPGLVTGLAYAGGGGNITTPHKQLALSLADEATAAAKRTGACNTFWAENRLLHVDNTDVAGFAAAVTAVLPELAGSRVLLLGAGGAARAVLWACCVANAAEVVISSRSAARAETLFPIAEGCRTTVRFAEARELVGGRFTLVVNSTTLGLQGSDPLPLDLRLLDGAEAAFDLVYGADTTPWVEHARGLGCPAVDGRGMLIEQAACAFERWFDHRAPRDQMTAALSRH